MSILKPNYCWVDIQGRCLELTRGKLNRVGWIRRKGCVWIFVFGHMIFWASRSRSLSRYKNEEQLFRVVLISYFVLLLSSIIPKTIRASNRASKVHCEFCFAYCSTTRLKTFDTRFHLCWYLVVSDRDDITYFAYQLQVQLSRICMHSTTYWLIYCFWTWSTFWQKLISRISPFWENRV